MSSIGMGTKKSGVLQLFKGNLKLETNCIT